MEEEYSIYGTSYLFNDLVVGLLERKLRVDSRSQTNLKPVSLPAHPHYGLIGRAGPEPAVNIISDHTVLEVPRVDSCFPPHSCRPSLCWLCFLKLIQ